MKAAKILVAALALSGVAVTGSSAASDGYHLLRLDGSFVKWGKPVLGTPARVTYAFATRRVHDAEARNCRSIDRPDALARRAGTDMAGLRREAEAAFRLWEQSAGVRFVEASSPDAADILIGAQSEPRGYAFANVRSVKPELALGGDRVVRRKVSVARPAPGPKVVPIANSTICLNPDHVWKTAFDGNLAAYDLRYTLVHEIGHAIGLDHENDGGQIMGFKYSEEFRGPQAGDIAGAQRLYGPPRPGN